jgi:hypothetical protein
MPKRMVVTVSVPVDMDDSALARIVNDAIRDEYPDPDATAWEWPSFWVDVAEGVVGPNGENP